jgi:hypothetical protein
MHRPQEACEYALILFYEGMAGEINLKGYYLIIFECLIYARLGEYKNEPEAGHGTSQHLGD